MSYRLLVRGRETFAGPIRGTPPQGSNRRKGIMDNNAQLKEVRADVKKLLEEMAEIKSLVETSAERCPYRELIAKSANNTRRLSILEKAVYGGGALATVVGAGILIAGAMWP